MANNFSDFNDLYILKGLDEVRSQILGTEHKKFYVNCLGYRKKTYFYTSSENLDIIAIEAHSEVDLLNLMPIEYWESQYPGEKMRVNWANAKSDLMNRCRQQGWFSDKYVRGPGVWMEHDKIIIHLGNRLYYDGKDHHIHSLKSQYIYTYDDALPAIDEPLDLSEMSSFLKLISKLPYSHHQQMYFLGGFIALSGICGALQWRPHIWLTGEPGSGKSTVKSRILDFYLENAFKYLALTGGTTEAGLRQALGNKAIPVVFDEFESEDEANNRRVKSILDFLRQASCEHSGRIVKGSANGQSQDFYARCCAIVCSIKPALHMEADRSRFTYVHCSRSGHNPEQWAELEKLLHTFSPEFARRLFSRCVKMLPVILKNKILLQKAFAKTHSQRLGEQYGSLLSGWQSLVSDDLMTEADAFQMVSMIDISAEGTVSHERDQEQALSDLLARRVHVDDGHRTLGEMILDADSSRHCAPLARFKIRVLENKNIFIAYNNPEVDKIFRGSKWSSGWYEVLGRLEGVIKKPIRVTARSKTEQGLEIPSKHFQS